MEWGLTIAEAALEQIDFITITDANGRYQYANRRWLEIHNLTLDQVRMFHPWDLVEDTQIRTVLEHRRPIYGYPFLLRGHHAFSSYIPLTIDDKFSGVLILTQTPESAHTKKLFYRLKELQQELENAKTKLNLLSTAQYGLNNIIGDSPAIQKVREEIIAAARTTSTVLIVGETGVGKELVAHAIHGLSNRSNARMVRVNCSAIPPELMESEFFGYEEGSFTGAKRGGKKGKFELANRGSIFLDEINQLPLSMQPKFLRVLQEREIERIGGRDVIPIDVRCIAATNQPLLELVKVGRFREDLYYRLNVLQIRVPPLRERREDIPTLSRYLLSKLNDRLGTSVDYIEPEAMQILMEYNWPGNIRELQNVLERAINSANDDALGAAQFKDLMQESSTVESQSPKAMALSSHGDYQMQRDALERTITLNALKEARWNKTSAAKILGISRVTLYKRLKNLGISDYEDFRVSDESCGFEVMERL